LPAESPAVRGDDRHVAEPTHGLGASGVGRHPAGNERLHNHLDVEGELGVDFLVDVWTPDPGPRHRAAYAGRRTGVIAAMNVASSRVSVVRCRRPFAVIE